ncbi:phage repressor like XRE family transcriptional regulator [Agrilactobacillus composti DSM 18527 = JCM 14202]|uniref:Phage repressor like XRE family transcriptional regulator n=1 Tax=Agrilactobacillus composti DSM 18527 = JCM 14202 TaxID=1423734 RepID=X0PI81_9LACO|nr:XRE family transcriptional regulator [Agrilactobacillus composti]KRM33393.1 phage repressor like XRE family transcriptional regulator [Agrilactobacillus composti DSM 18527 = JCM 14202]GAF41768.1 phage repressor [Agrilactobacillus composti DSM 18527 = JCM 14202]
MQTSILGPAIRKLRQSKKMTQAELSRLTGFTQNTVSQHENGRRTLDEKAIAKYAQALGTTPQKLYDLFSDKRTPETSAIIDATVQKMTKLHPARQKNVYAYVRNQFEEQTNINNVINFPAKSDDSDDAEITLSSGRSTAAGAPIDGDYQDSNRTSMVMPRSEVPSGADEVVTIAGDSMEPDLKEGSQQFIHYQPVPDYNGQVVIVSIQDDFQDDGVTCKKFFRDGDQVRLASINPKYDDMIFSADRIRVIATVIPPFNRKPLNTNESDKGND